MYKNKECCDLSFVCSWSEWQLENTVQDSVTTAIRGSDPANKLDAKLNVMLLNRMAMHLAAILELLSYRKRDCIDKKLISAANELIDINIKAGEKLKSKEKKEGHT